jgi:transcriptional regulator with XRE-family HTH domain
MISPSKTMHQNASLERRDLAEYGVARFRDQTFDSVLALWRQRKSEGWTQKFVAARIGRDPGWVSRNLRAPGNWTTRTAGELIQGLNGEAEIRVTALEEPAEVASNYDAYEGYISSTPGPLVNLTISINTRPYVAPATTQGTAQIRIGADQSFQLSFGFAG